MKNSLQPIILFLLILLAANSQAQPSIQVGEALPSLEISNKGELVINNDRISYQPWSSSQLGKKVHVLQYLAGRMSASKINEPFTDRLGEMEFTRDHYHSTTIINLNDTFFGTGGFVNRELKSNKIKHSWPSIIADKKGRGASQWGLKAASSAIIIVSAEGTVLFFKDGGLNTDEIDTVLKLVQYQIQLLNTDQPTATN